MQISGNDCWNSDLSSHIYLTSILILSEGTVCKGFIFNRLYNPSTLYPFLIKPQCYVSFLIPYECLNVTCGLTNSNTSYVISDKIKQNLLLLSFSFHTVMVLMQNTTRRRGTTWAHWSLKERMHECETWSTHSRRLQSH